MTSVDLSKGILKKGLKRPVRYQKKETDFELGTYVFFDKKNLYTLGDGDGEMEYKENDKPNLHLGQLKLLLSEMQMLIYYADNSIVKTIVYAGAAHGNHIYILSKLFPDFTYHLYDISENWDERLYEKDNIFVNNKYFDDIELEKWQNFTDPVIFISDIRTLDVDEKKGKEREAVVGGDMMLQKNWVEKIKPCISLLKFKLPFPDNPGQTLNYLDGAVYRQFYPPSQSAETRLLVKGISYRDWNLSKYERKCAFFNRIIRNKGLFLNPFDNTNRPIYPERGLQNDFESVGFCNILMDYLVKINLPVEENNVKKLFDIILDEVYYNKKLDLEKERGLQF